MVVKAETRSFAPKTEETRVELEPIKNPAKATAPTVARGVNKLHQCVEAGFKDVKLELSVIRKALHIDEEGNRLKGATPLAFLSTWSFTWRGLFVIFGGISATAFIWKAIFALWPSIVVFGQAINHFVTGQ